MMNKMCIVIWRGVIVDYMMMRDLIGVNEVITPANQSELKMYYDRPGDSKRSNEDVPKDGKGKTGL